MLLLCVAQRREEEENAEDLLRVVGKPVKYAQVVQVCVTRFIACTTLMSDAVYQLITPPAACTHLLVGRQLL